MSDTRIALTTLQSFANAEPDDQKLIERSLRNDQKAFEVLVRRYQKLVYNLLFQMVREHDVAADLTQDTFIKAYRALANYKTGANFKPWILKIATNSCLNYLRDTKRLTSLDAMLEEDPSLEPVSAVNVEREVELRISQQELFDALSQLNARQRNIFILRYHNDLSYEDIAAIAGEPVSTVKSMLFRIRDKLRKILVPPETIPDKQTPGSP